MELAILDTIEHTNAKKLGKVTYDSTTKRFFSESKEVQAIYGKVFLSTKYEDNEAVKKLGARWDGKKKQHYCKESEREKFAKYILSNVRVYVEVPPVFKSEFQRLYGMKFDGDKKKWYVDESKRCEELEDFYAL